ncbi:hypothetical protein EV421DRAFT_1731185 [Armillaria borealis]|uniref:Uncharacterized protein n=1 Tax=Armillaria borealis TaxID=47425 RepID=A0AA39K334_9AGAR|nr:hypothetical protein EV421DRAFT_1731185 [Armillaria borealis]
MSGWTSIAPGDPPLVREGSGPHPFHGNFNVAAFINVTPHELVALDNGVAVLRNFVVIWKIWWSKRSMSWFSQYSSHPAIPEKWRRHENMDPNQFQQKEGELKDKRRTWLPSTSQNEVQKLRERVPLAVNHRWLNTVGGGRDVRREGCMRARRREAAGSPLASVAGWGTGVTARFGDGQAGRAGKAGAGKASVTSVWLGRSRQQRVLRCSHAPTIASTTISIRNHTDKH